MHQEHHRYPFIISTDQTRLDIDTIHAFLCYESRWARGREKTTILRSIQHSLCFGLYDENVQIGFARVISDYTTYAYLDDVYVLDTHRGKGLGKWLLECVLAHPELQSITRFGLVTQDKQEFYQELGWVALKYPDRHMERLPPGYYSKEI